MSDKVIIVENLSKRYRIGLKEMVHDSLVGMLLSWARAPLSNYKRLRKLSRFDENGQTDDIIWALKDVSFEVQEGEVLGIIGRNGAGKSTLLKILSRITDPTQGTVKTRGRVSSLLEVGTGFHPELTGRENVYLNGTIIGMSKKEIDKKFDEIVEFSGVEKFIDTPIKRYSTGMNVRLAFSVAAHIEPEILIIDEVLAVGDVDFQKKCLGKMGDIAEVGRTVLFVSHNMGAVSHLCDRVMLLQHGGVKRIGDTKSVIKDYLAIHKVVGEVDLTTWNDDRTGDGPMKLMYFKTMNENGNVKSVFKFGEPITFATGISGKKNEKIILGIFIRNEMGQLILHFTSEDDNDELVLSDDFSELQVRMSPNILNYGTYYVSVWFGDYRGYLNDRVEDCLAFSIYIGEEGNIYTSSNIRLRVDWEVRESLIKL